MYIKVIGTDEYKSTDEETVLNSWMFDFRCQLS
jgi:hypothetical protein